MTGLRSELLRLAFKTALDARAEQKIRPFDGRFMCGDPQDALSKANWVADVPTMGVFAQFIKDIGPGHLRQYDPTLWRDHFDQCKLTGPADAHPIHFIGEESPSLP